MTQNKTLSLTELQELCELQAAQIRNLRAMLAYTAHEINNPLTVISVRSQMLAQLLGNGEGGADPAPLLASAEKISGQAERIKSQVEKMRVYSNQIGGAELSECHLAGLLRDSFALVAAAHKEKRASLRLEGGEGVVLNARPADLSYVFMTLLTQLVAASAAGSEPVIQVSCGSAGEAHQLIFSGAGGPESALSLSSKILQIYGGGLRQEGAEIRVTWPKSSGSRENTQIQTAS